ncbi:SDR family oxidoreductase [Agrobacterium tumefaciens]|uniref:SDR family oxidoreductase n=1 Tax=Agrobacterium tumefaciens TaxID=358 RepID=UPI0015727FE0|nr:SDR family oxidoreductase [Agrobacterium tumefaciens]
MTIIVTGASGKLGRATISELLKTVAPSKIAALVRDPAKVNDLLELGIDVRQGDYADKESLVKAFKGVEKLLLVSGTVSPDRLNQQLNAISAARDARVNHVVYTSIQRREASGYFIPMVTDVDRATEAALKNAGGTYTIMQNSLYLDVLPFTFAKNVLNEGIRLPGGPKGGALAARSDLASANAIVLTEDGHNGKTYSLGASETATFSDMAATLSKVCGKDIRYSDIPVETFVIEKSAEGFPAEAARFLSEWLRALGDGEFGEVSGDLERILGRKPITCDEFLAAHYTH